MSSHKRRNREQHSPSSDRKHLKHSKKNDHDPGSVNRSYERSKYENSTNSSAGESDYENQDHTNSKHHSKEKKYEESKKHRHQVVVEQHHNRHKVTHENFEYERRRKDYKQTENRRTSRDNHTKDVSVEDSDYSESRTKDKSYERHSHNSKQERYEKSRYRYEDDDDYAQHSKNACEEDGEYYLRGEKYRKENRHRKSDWRSEVDDSYRQHNREQGGKKYVSDEDDHHYSSNKRKDRNSESGTSYDEKDKRRKKSDWRYEFHTSDIRRNEIEYSDDDYPRRKEKERSKQGETASKEDSTRGRHSNNRGGQQTQSVVHEVNRNVRNQENGNLEANSNVPSNTNAGTNTNEVKAPKKMISGAYIPPAKLKLMQQEITDKGSIEYQKISWEALKKSINGLTNKVNTSNINDIVRELFRENIIRGRGVLTRALMQAQALSPTFTHVYAALVAVINTKFPDISEVLLKRLILQFKRGFRRNDKQACLSSVRFMAHLLNQQVAHEVLILEILTLLLENPTDHSVEVAIAMLKECGKRLEELSKRGTDAIFSRLRHVLHEGNLDKRTQYMIEVLFAVRKDKFKDYPSVMKELDLVEEDDKFTHLITLDEAVDAEELLNVFKFDPDYEANEERYKSLVKEILGDSDSEDSGDSEAETDSEEENDEDGESQQILDMTETNLVALRRNIYLTIQSSLDFEECAHKLLKMDLKPGEVMEMCYMILDCCAQQRTYEKFYGLLAQRFCQLNKMYLEPFMEIFRNSYETIHRLETNKLRNVAKFFAHLLYTDAIHWNVLSNIKLNETDTSSSSRIFIKILFQELCEYMGLPLLNERVKDVTLQEAFDGLFPRDNPHNTRFAINFFTSIGLGGLTDELREHLKNTPKNPVIKSTNEKPSEDSSGSEDLSSEDSSSSSSESSEDSEDDGRARKQKKYDQKTSNSSQKHKTERRRNVKHKNHRKSSEAKHKHRH